MIEHSGSSIDLEQIVGQGNSNSMSGSSNDNALNRRDFVKATLTSGVMLFLPSWLLSSGCGKGSEKGKTTSDPPPQTPSSPDIIYSPNKVYSLVRIVNQNSTEYRAYREQHHFMSVIEDLYDFIIRPHPGKDVNGWGSSWYPLDFKVTSILKRFALDSIVVDDTGITLNASSITQGNNRIMRMKFGYDAAEKKVTGSGAYSISLAASVKSQSSDLTVTRIQTNYLEGVPLLSGGVGNTGDMEKIEVVGDTFSFDWIPKTSYPGHFPQDDAENLSINVTGQYNNVDTAAQGYHTIAAAYKPSLKVVLHHLSSAPATKMIYGVWYDPKTAKQFWSDNVGITPLILKSSPERQFEFDLEFESKALPGDK